MPRFTKAERAALDYIVQDVLAGDPVEYYNNGCPVSDPPEGKDEKEAYRLADALLSASRKLYTADASKS